VPGVPRVQFRMFERSEPMNRTFSTSGTLGTPRKLLKNAS